MLVDRFDSIFDVVDVFFRQRLVETNKTTVVATRILDVGSTSIESLLDGVLGLF